MRVYAPDYYNEFSCIAEKCLHNCCIGWEIDIDDEALKYYKNFEGSFKKRIIDGICFGENPHFKLSQNERCPFLNENNLCDIISELGEDKLCQICTDHPRFRNFYDEDIEIGLGLCCEEAARIILNYKKKTKIIIIEDDNEQKEIDEQDIFFNIRDNIFNIMQDRTRSVNQRIEEISKKFKVYLPEKTYSEWADIFSKLEILDKSWIQRLDDLKALDCIEERVFKKEEFEIAFEQLTIYFLYRHLQESLYDGKFMERMAFCILCTKIIKALCFSEYLKKGEISIEDIIEISRMFSSEIEYCEDNISNIITVL